MRQIRCPLILACRDVVEATKLAHTFIALPGEQIYIRELRLVGLAGDKLADLSDANAKTRLRRLDRTTCRTTLNLKVYIRFSRLGGRMLRICCCRYECPSCVGFEGVPDPFGIVAGRCKRSYSCQDCFQCCCLVLQLGFQSEQIGKHGCGHDLHRLHSTAVWATGEIARGVAADTQP